MENLPYAYYPESLAIFKENYGTFENRKVLIF